MPSIYRAKDALCSKEKGHEGDCGVGGAVNICGKRLFPKNNTKDKK